MNLVMCTGSKAMQGFPRMDNVSTGKYGDRSVNWAHPMNNSTHLPPKSPHGGYSMFSSSSLFENNGGLNFPPCQPIRGGEHRRSPSAGYVPQGQPTWQSVRLASSDGIVVKKCSHRRSSSDSVAFVDNSYQCMNYLEHVTEEDEFVFQEPPISAYRPAHRKGLSADYDSYSSISPTGNQNPQYKLLETHRLYPGKSMRGDHNINRLGRDYVPRIRDSEPFQRQQSRHENVAAYNRVGSNLAKSVPQEDSRNLGKAKKHVTLAIPNLKSDGTSSSKGRVHNLGTNSTLENRSTASESNSLSDDSNDDVRPKSYEKLRGDSELRTEGDGNAPALAHDDCTSSEQLDPKKAKRILANRQSAQRSRVRKLQYISELEMNVSVLESEVASLSPKVGYYDHERARLSAENVLLKQKLAALTKSQRLKEAHSESLKSEAHRLLQLYNQQQQQTQHHAERRSLSADILDLQLMRFSQLDIGPQIPKPKSPNGYTSVVRPSSGRPSLYPSKVISPPHDRIISRPSSHTIPPSCMAPGGKTLAGGMMGGSSTSFMVHNL
uniref:BZIP domain-containing protein n=1 Tax=Physcomitrium patens TaxID=3218 RepID=A0A7I4FCN6_PHYPA